ncbi:MAG: QcrA and Rieske domain-containing protein [Solirubrobacteraceae bacterium]
MPDPHKQAKSRYTQDRGLPGAFDGETVTRRAFMNVSAQTAGGIAAGAFTLPALAFALGPLFSREPFQWQPVGTPLDFNQLTYVTKVITIVPGVGEAGKTIAYIRKRNSAIDTEKADQYNQYIALSSRCMHLGCPVRYVQAAERFICPCHGGVYNFRGIVAGGPPVRPLDRFYTRFDKTTGLVEVGPRYSVNSELERFSPRDPGQPLDGVGQFLYPKRFSTSILPRPNDVQ